MDGNDELSQLEELLSADLDNTINNSKAVSIREVDMFTADSNNIEHEAVFDGEIPDKPSVIHNGDTDSSDDEETRNCIERKYNDYGSQVKKMLDNQQHEQKNKSLEFEMRLRQTNMDIKVSQSTFKTPKPVNELGSKNIPCTLEPKIKTSSDIYTDPIFGIRITKPLISSSALLDRMQGREAINMLRVKRHVENEDLSKDWVIAGVIVRKSSVKKSQKGNQFVIWTLSDLKDDLKTISMFLFRKAYNELWKTTEGTVVAVLNPNVLDRSQNSSDQACLSVENPDRIMILGQSKDFGICKSRKKNGEPCTAFVNLSQCDHCIYHIKQEYQKYSRRQELQSSTMGKGLVNLQKKVLGKSTVIYGGKAYSALPFSNTTKVRERDNNRLMSLSDYHKLDGDKFMTNKAPYGAHSVRNNLVLHSPAVQKSSDAERLNKLSGVSLTTSPAAKSQNLSLAEKVGNSPKLGKLGLQDSSFGLKGNGTIDLNISYGQKAAERAKANAVRLIHQNGGLTKSDPNNLKGTEAGKKRALDKLYTSNNDENYSKKSKLNEEIVSEQKKFKGVMSERFKKILEASSAHQNLIQQHDDDEQDKYFSKLEKKEKMEDKMLNTFKLACKAVRCVKCKYTAFSAAQLCKDERHPLKVLDTFKRFFKCADCNNRTVSLEIIPLHSCSNCRGSRWEKAPMIREKKVTSLSEGLSIRGEEESYIGGQINAGKNINLLVPE